MASSPTGYRSEQPQPSNPPPSQPRRNWINKPSTRWAASAVVTVILGVAGWLVQSEDGRGWWKEKHPRSFDYVMCQDFLWDALKHIARNECGSEQPDKPDTHEPEPPVTTGPGPHPTHILIPHIVDKLDQYLWLASERRAPKQASVPLPSLSEEKELVEVLRTKADLYERFGNDHLVINSDALRPGDEEGEFNVYVGYYVLGEEKNGEWQDSPKGELEKADAWAQYRVMDLNLKFSWVDGEAHLDRWGITRFTDSNFQTHTVRIRAVTLDDRKVPKDIFGSYPIPAVVQDASGELLKSRSREDLMKAPVKHVFCQLSRQAASGDVRERPWVRTTAGWIPREWMHKGVKNIRNAGPPGTVPLEEVRPCEPGSTLYRPTVGVVVDDKRSFPE